MTSVSPDCAIDALLARLTRSGGAREGKIAVAALVLQCLERYRTSLCPQRKLHFVNAIGTLSLRRGSGKRTTLGELRIALLDLKKAVASDLPGCTVTVARPISSVIDYEMLRHAAMKCVQRGPNLVGMQPPVSYRDSDALKAFSQRPNQAYRRPASAGHQGPSAQ